MAQMGSRNGPRELGEERDTEVRKKEDGDSGSDFSQPRDSFVKEDLEGWVEFQGQEESSPGGGKRARAECGRQSVHTGAGNQLCMKRAEER